MVRVRRGCMQVAAWYCTPHPPLRGTFSSGRRLGVKVGLPGTAYLPSDRLAEYGDEVLMITFESGDVRYVAVKYETVQADEYNA